MSAEFLAALLRSLRAQGVAVSPGEAIDAARALEIVSLEDRALVEAALGATLAKSRAARAALPGALAAALPRLEGAGAGEGRARRRGQAPRGGPGEPGGPGGAAGATSTSTSKSTSTSTSAPMGHGRAASAAVPPAARPGERRAREAREAALARLDAADASRDGRGASDPAAPAGSHEERRRRRRRARLAPVLVSRAPQSSPAELEGEAALLYASPGAGPPGPRPDVSPRRTPRGALRAGGPDQDLLRRDLRGPLGPEDEERLERLLERLLATLRGGASRRRRAARRGTLDVHRLFRRAVATGGMPFTLARRGRARRPLRLVLLVDVSWSARRAARAFLVLARALARRFRETRVLLFVDRPVEVRGAAARGEGLRRAARPATAAPGLRPSGRSDYAKALFALLRDFSDALRRDALLVVLGDARNNRLPAEAWCLEDAAARVAGVVWLVPEPRAQWGAGDSAILEYAPACDLVREGATLADLAAAVAGLARVR